MASLALTTTLPACLDRPISPAKPTTTNLFVNSIPNHVVNKADLLFMIDNSMSMADKQQILADAVPVLVQRLATPRCLDMTGNPTGKVSDVTGHCDNGRPEFAALKDIHVGVITSSLGSHGGNVCAPDSDVRTPDDRGELLPTANPAVRGAIDSWNNQGFLAWDPTQKKNVPPGDGDLAHLTAGFRDQVEKAGENGCGFEGSLESWYRFLVDPEPPVNVTTAKAADGIDRNQKGPINQTLLAQRAAFLRPDSLLAIVMLTDENDCSVNDDDGTQGFLASTLHASDGSEYHLPRASAACATNPDDRCCHTCDVEAPADCTPNASDAECSKPGHVPKTDDVSNLRCFDERRRFGLDLLYPIQRYIDGLTAEKVPNRANEEVINPIFRAPRGQPPRPKDLVLLAGIVGVPWQDIATPDSLTGPDLTYLTAKELRDKARWDVIAGSDDGSPPSDPFMRESIAPRTGKNPVTGDAILPPNSGEAHNAINGHEQNITGNDDLQYACTFELPEARPCADDQSCDCSQDDADYARPLCNYPDGPSTNGQQHAAKAYPGLRELDVLRGVKDNGIVASICPKHTSPAAGLAPEADASYGYNPAVNALGVIISQRLSRQCLPRPLNVEADPAAPTYGQVPCSVVEALPFGEEGACSCDESHGRSLLGSGDAKLRASVSEQLYSQGQCGGGSGVDCHAFCLCKVKPLQGGELEACQQGTESASSFGYCYIDPAQGIGSEALIADCPATTRRSLRFVGDGLPANGSITFMACIGTTFDER